MQHKKVITLKNLLINGTKHIGLLFYPDKVIQALIKEIPDVRWSKKYNMPIVPNTKGHLRLIFSKYKVLPGSIPAVFLLTGLLKIRYLKKK